MIPADMDPLSLDFVGQQGDRYVFRFHDQPHRLLMGDLDDYLEFRRVRAAHAIAVLTGNKAVCSGGCMCQPENHPAGTGACGKKIAPVMVGS